MSLRAGALAVALLIVSSAAESRPRGPVGLDVLPSLFELTVRPGERIEKTVTLTNPADEPISAVASLSDWTMNEEGTVQFEDAGRQPLSCASWITVEPREVRVGPREHAVVNLTIQAPSDFSGTRWAVLFFSMNETPGSVKGRAVTFAPRIGVTVYVTAQGTQRDQIELAASSASGNADGKALLRTTFDNGGNTAVRIRLTWQIRTLAGAIVATQSTTLVSLPGSRRQAAATTEAALAPGSYRVTAMARWGSRKWQAKDCDLVVSPRSSASS